MITDSTDGRPVGPKRPQNETIEEQVTRECQASIVSAYERLARMQNLPAEVRNLPVSRLNELSVYF